MLGIVSLWLNMISYEAQSCILIIYPTKVTFCEPRIPLVKIGLCPLEDVLCERGDLPLMGSISVSQFHSLLTGYAVLTFPAF